MVILERRIHDGRERTGVRIGADLKAPEGSMASIVRARADRARSLFSPWRWQQARACGCWPCSATRARCGSPATPTCTLAPRCGHGRICPRRRATRCSCGLCEPFHSLTLVTGVQHLMGLDVAVMIYLLLRRSGVPPRWATVATLPVLLDGFEIEDEHMVMAEALFTFLVMLAMLLILWRARVPWPVALLAGLWPATRSTCAARDCRCWSCSRPSCCCGPDARRLAELARVARRDRDGRGLRGARAGLRGVVSRLGRLPGR